MYHRFRSPMLPLRVGAVLGVGAAAWWLMGLYSVGPSYASYLSPARAFLRAALSSDSAALVRQGADQPVVLWALHEGRAQSLGLRALEQGLTLGSGTAAESGATVVWFDARADGECVDWSLRMTFHGTGAERRIARAIVYCGTRVTPPGYWSAKPAGAA